MKLQKKFKIEIYILNTVKLNIFNTLQSNGNKEKVKGSYRI